MWFVLPLLWEATAISACHKFQSDLSFEIKEYELGHGGGITHLRTT
jgi:hypothetical protein